MNRIPSALILGLVFLACESSTDQNSNVQFNISSCRNVGEKRAAEKEESAQGRLIFRSKDSLSFSVPMQLNCGAEYSMYASIAAPETLSVSIADIGDSRARCFCDKEITIGFQSPDADMDKIGFVKIGERVFELN
jgi:hypothetical protein